MQYQIVQLHHSRVCEILEDKFYPGRATSDNTKMNLMYQDEKSN